VSMATGGETSVLGGNRQIFDSFVTASGAKLRLGEEVSTKDLLPVLCFF
jgi:hypothetical protein